MNVLIIGAHPDDCEYRFAGTAALLVEAGHAVKFLNLTNGNAGHHEMAPVALALRRARESAEAARRLGIVEVETLAVDDGTLTATLDLRREVIRRIRAFRADVVITHRPCDYHPDHRYASVLVQDAAFMVTVPAACPEVPALRRNPVFLYLQDEFTKPTAFAPDLVIDIDPVWHSKVAAIDAHESQFYEWLPWLEGVLEQVPVDADDRRRWLSEWLTSPIEPAVRQALERRYGAERAAGVRHAEALELCEFGRRAEAAELAAMFPR